MPTVQIRNVPPDVHRVLRRRAAEAGQSLQEYMLGWVTEGARKPTPKELFARVAERSGGSMSLDEVVEWLRSDREGH